MDFDRSRFADREILDPHHVMEGSHGGASASMPEVGQHTDGNLAFLKKGEVDLGVRACLTPAPSCGALRAEP